MSFQNQILGTIISSVLNYDQFNDAIREARGCHVNSSYAPCDGRSVAGSSLAPILQQNTGSTSVPDLRGKFIRGLNIFHSPGQNPFDVNMSDPDGLNRVPGQYQPDSIEKHSHSYTHFDGGVVSDYSDDKDHRKASYGNMVGATTNEVGKADETRPRNVSVYFYIKIN
jgi:hypothetical protein